MCVKTAEIDGYDEMMLNDSNPWLAVPAGPPYVLACDRDAVQMYQAQRRDERCRLELDVLPEPFIGVTTAPVVLLILNPGFEDGDIADHARGDLQALIRDNYRQNESSFPFYSLNPAFDNGGRRWWEKKLKYLLREFEREQLAQSILSVDYFPYHSRHFAHSSPQLPSQEFGFRLVRSAIARGAVIVIMRGQKLWKETIPELQKYSNTFALNSAQNVVLSPRNCARYDVLTSAIRGSS